MFLTGFRCEWNDFLIASVGGLIHLGTSLLHNYIVMRSLAGAAEALLQTSHTFQILIDMILFVHIPNVIQILGMAFAFLSALLIIISNKSE